jgi:hypothetical protein
MLVANALCWFCHYAAHIILQIQELIADCFVTGKWDENKDAEALLQKDGKYFMNSFFMEEMTR